MGHFTLDTVDKGFRRDHPLIALGTTAYRDLTGLNFTFPQNGHQRNFFEFCLPDFSAQFFAGIIQARPQSTFFELLQKLLGCRDLRVCMRPPQP